MAETRAFEVTIRQAVHPITSDVLTQAFRAAGETEQVTVNNPETNTSGETIVSAFVVFRDAASGQNALRTLQGRAIYPNSCFVELKPSAANPAHAAAYGGPLIGGYGGGYPGAMHHQQHYHHHHAGAYGGHHHHHHHHHQHHAMHHHHHGFGGHHQHHGGAMGFDQQHQPPYGGHHHHMMHHQQHHHHSFAMRGAGMMPGGGFMPRGRGFGAPGGMMMGVGGPPPGTYGMRGGFGMRGGADMMGTAAYGVQQGMMMGGGGGYAMSPSGEPAVLLVSGVPTNVSLMKLFILLEVYGVVLGLRRQLKQPETVIAKFEVFHDAILCAKLLSGTPFFGTELQVRHFAGFTDRQGFAPGAGANADPEDPECQTFDFTTTRHRGRPHGHGGVTGRKYSPGPHLFIGNLLEAISDNEAREMFTTRGFEVVDFERKSAAHALCSLKDTQASIEALIATHSIIVKERFIKVTFSGFAPHSTAPGAAAGAGAAGNGATAPPNNNNNASPPTELLLMDLPSNEGAPQQ